LSSAPRPITVVLVDDAEAVRNLYRSRLDRSEHFQVVGEAADGQEGLMVARTHQPDLVLLDIAMPVMDGLQALPLICVACPATSVVMLTAVGNSTGLSEKTQALGSASYIIKGTPMAAMLQELLRVVRGVNPAPPELQAT
jgi:DNA-binding NarL/FixJ family response regulator